MDMVVIVDNSRKMLDNYKRMVESGREEIHCIYFQYPEEAVAYIREEGAAVLVCELELPVMSGKEVFDMVEMISPGTIKIAMTQVTDVRKTLEIMNQSRIFKLILKPFFLSEDILKPIKAALKYHEMLEREKGVGIEAEIPERRIKKPADEAEHKEMIYDSVYAAMVGMVRNNLQNGSAEFSQEEKDEAAGIFTEMFQEFMRYYMFETQNYIFHINYLMNLFHRQEKNRNFQMKNGINGDIPDIILKKMMYTIFWMGYLYKEIMEQYKVVVELGETEEEYIVKLLMETVNEEKNQAGNRKITRLMLQMAKKIEEICHMQIEKGTIENMQIVKIYYKKGEASDE